MELSPLHILAVALGLGLLVGLQREFTHNPIGGIRTYPLITILGALSGLIAESYGVWIVAVAFLGLVALSIMANMGLLGSHKELDPSLTTELAILSMFMVGVSLAAGFTLVSLSVTGLITVLLQWKKPLHNFVNTLAETDLWAVARLVLISLVILPMLPNQNIGPYNVINPFEIWLMVVLIVGISLGAYIAARIWGAQSGSIVAGILGGLISSTATTASFAQQSKREKNYQTALIVIMIASTVVFARVIIEIALVSPAYLPDVAPPLVILMLVMLALSSLVLLTQKPKGNLRTEPEAPEGLRTAIIFGLLYGFILLAIAWAKTRFGTSGIYLIASISGLTDVDAITLSSMQLLNDGQISPAVAWRVVLISIMSNLVFKAFMVLSLGVKRLFRFVAVLFTLTLLAGGVLLWLWPA